MTNLPLIKTIETISNQLNKTETKLLTTSFRSTKKLVETGLDLFIEKFNDNSTKSELMLHLYKLFRFGKRRVGETVEYKII